jgi:lysozyme family protein
MAIDNFGQCLAFTWRPENDGQDTHTDPGDPGGMTRYGVTWATWRNWCERRGIEASPEQFARVDLGALRAVYQFDFWNTIQGDRLPAGVDLMAFDFGVTAGPLRSARFLQSFIGAGKIAVDGVIGPKTLAALAGYDPATVVQGLTKTQIEYYKALPTFAEFGHGWERRTYDRARLALTMAKVSHEFL